MRQRPETARREQHVHPRNHTKLFHIRVSGTALHIFDRYAQQYLILNE